MSDLINRKAVMKFLSDKNKDGMPESATAKVVYCFIENLIDEIRDGIPTAYDVGKVVERLETELEANTYYSKLYDMGIKEAISIVKGVVKDE